MVSSLCTVCPRDTNLFSASCPIVSSTISVIAPRSWLAMSLPSPEAMSSASNPVVRSPYVSVILVLPFRVGAIHEESVTFSNVKIIYKYIYLSIFKFA